MVTKRKSPVKARTRTVYRAAPRKRSTSKKAPQYANIPAAAATVALAAVNVNNFKGLMRSVSNNGRSPIADYPARFYRGFTGKNDWVSENMKKFVSSESLVKDGIAIVGGYIGGELVRKYAPTVLKKPIAKIAKKIPKVM